MSNGKAKRQSKSKAGTATRAALKVRRWYAKKNGLPIPDLPPLDRPIYKGKCKSCGVEVVRKKADGRTDRCNKCRRLEHRQLEYAKRNKERKSRGRLIYKGSCSGCGVEVVRYKADGRIDRCDDCRTKELHAAMVERNPDIYKKRYWKERDRHLAHAKQWAKKNRARRRQIANAWHKRHRDKSSAAYMKYMAAKMHRIPPWADLDAIKAFYEIARRVTKCTGIRFEVDHIVPLRGRDVSGLHVPNNLRVIPKSMNSRKSNIYEGEDSWHQSAHQQADSTTLRRSRTSQVL